MERLTVHKGERPTDGTFLEHYFRYRFAETLVQDASVLDCACGTGYGTYILARKAKQVAGVDRSPEALRVAAANWAAPNIRYFALDIEQLESLKEEFDAIVSFETIEHLADPLSFVAKAYDQLCDRGIFIVSTPNKNAYRAGLEPNPFHLCEFSPDEFVDLLSRKFGHVELFVQMAPDQAGQPKRKPGPSMCYKLKTGIVDAFVRTSPGYYLYLLRMTKRFSVSPARQYHDYQYLIGVCRK